MGGRVDLSQLETVGDPVPVQEGVLTKPGGAANFSVSDNGTLIYVSGTAAPLQARSLVWVDRSGKEEPVGLSTGDYFTLSLSPDGTRAATTNIGAGGNDDICPRDGFKVEVLSLPNTTIKYDQPGHEVITVVGKRFHRKYNKEATEETEKRAIRLFHEHLGGGLESVE